MSLKLKIKLNKKNLHVIRSSQQNWVQGYLDPESLNHLPCQMDRKDPLFWMDTHHVSNHSLLCFGIIIVQ